MDNGVDEEELAVFLNENGSNQNSKLVPLELESSDRMFPAEERAPGLRQRRSVSENERAGRTSFIEGFMQGLLRQNIGSHFTFRNMLVLSGIASFLLLAVIVLNAGVEQESEHVTTKPPHTTSFGGIHNPGIEHGSSGQFRRPPVITEDDLPKSNVGHAIPSLSELNVENHQAHYRHDPLVSPYASKLYAANVESQEERTRLQQDFDGRMETYRKRYGEWKDPPSPGDKREPFLSNFLYKDAPAEAFPANSWQTNKEYMGSFLREAMRLVNRVKEAIYDEYGFGKDSINETDADAVQQLHVKRNTYFGVRVGDFEVKEGAAVKDGIPLPGSAYLNQPGWEALIRKLLHAIMTEDEFYVVAAGPTAHTIDGVPFSVTHVMQFHDIMEPVFDRLGVRLISRNMGMDASAVVGALGGGDIFGETDIFWYIDDPEKRTGAQELDFLQKQMLLSGERVPVLLTPNPVNLKIPQAWIGNIQPGPMGCKETDAYRGKPTLPHVKACHYAACSDKLVQTGKCRGDKKYPCWIDRPINSIIGNEDLNQKDSLTPTTTSWNHRQHQLEGRKLAVLVLEALSDALKRMLISTETAQTKVLPTKNWWVGDVYNDLRETVRKEKIVPGMEDFDLSIPPCEKLLKNLDPDICHMEMHVYTEWTPRITPKKNGLSSIAAPGGFVNETDGTEHLYGWFDLLPLKFALDSDEMDVHMVAIQGDALDYGSMRRDTLAIAGSPDVLEEVPPRNLADGTESNLWRLHMAPLGFCDGSAMSWCNKVLGNDCLLENKNHYKGGMLSRGSTDWLVLQLGEIKEGIVLIRFEYSKEYGNNKKLPADLKFYYSIEGPEGTIESLTGSELLQASTDLSEDLTVYPLLLDRSWSHNETLSRSITLALKFETAENDFQMLLTHLYYA